MKNCALNAIIHTMFLETTQYDHLLVSGSLLANYLLDIVNTVRHKQLVLPSTMNAFVLEVRSEYLKYRSRHGKSLVLRGLTIIWSLYKFLVSTLSKYNHGINYISYDANGGIISKFKSDSELPFFFVTEEITSVQDALNIKFYALLNPGLDARPDFALNPTLKRTTSVSNQLLGLINTASSEIKHAIQMTLYPIHINRMTDNGQGFINTPIIINERITLPMLVNGTIALKWFALQNVYMNEPKHVYAVVKNARGVWTKIDDKLNESHHWNVQKMSRDVFFELASRNANTLFYKLIEE